ncbi:MAG: hypothetical protein HKN25_17465 [Pyrinomonadaceae bacterium]|nr:hypothetical protein [Pyrinomonadaceae bacterium]
MFVVLYRWSLIHGAEESFVSAWQEVTKYFLDNFDSLGSRLHKGDDGIWYAYAQWKSAEQRNFAAENSPDLEDVFKQMRNATKERYSEIVLDIHSDLLKRGNLD